MFGYFQSFFYKSVASAKALKQSALTTQPRRHFSNQNNGKYTDRRSKGVSTGQKIMSEQEELEY